MSDRFPFFDPYFRENGPFSFFGRDMPLDPKPDVGPEGRVQPVADRLGDNPQPSGGDVNMLGRLIFAEGADHFQVPGAMEGIGWAVRNRVGAPSFPTTLQGVIAQPGQFAGFGSKLWDKAEDPSTLTGPNATAYRHALDVAHGVLSGRIPDPSGGAQYFYTSGNGDPPPESFFAKSMEQGRLVRSGDRIGTFTFLRDTQSP